MTLSAKQTQQDLTTYEIGVMRCGPYLLKNEIHIPHRLKDATEASNKWARLSYSPDKKVYYLARHDERRHEYIVRTSANALIAQEQLALARDEYYGVYRAIDRRVVKTRKFRIMYATVLGTQSMVDIESELRSSAIEQAKTRAAFGEIINVMEV